MPFSLNLIHAQPAVQLASDPYDSSSSDSTETPRRPRQSLSTDVTPFSSRPPSPSLQTSILFSEGDEPGSPLLGGMPGLPRARRLWWGGDLHTRRRPRRSRDVGRGWKRSVKRTVRRIIAHPLFPTQPTTILFSLLAFTLFALMLTLFLIYLLNPDKAPLPWRSYCALAQPFPPPEVNLDALPPAGVFVGVFSMDSAIERRMLVRSTFASHVRSRVGASTLEGRDTGRTVVRFILGRPRAEWERRIQLEMETYNDLVILPIAENMNNGKTHAYFTWAAESAWVPPPIPALIPANETSTVPLSFSYSNITGPVFPLAPHDPRPANGEQSQGWVRPDFVIKADDDSFVMLAELEARLRVELHSRGSNMPSSPSTSSVPVSSQTSQEPPSSSSTAEPSLERRMLGHFHPHITEDVLVENAPKPEDDPLVYWGYLVKNRFMGGELYGLSWSLVGWVAQDEAVKGLTKGAEDKQVAKWMHLHPRADEVRWKSEHCWIYDHPRAGTVYSHGFLFPSEATRVRRSLTHPDPLSPSELTPADALSFSTVSEFGKRYQPPFPGLTPSESVEALVEGSALSQVTEPELVTGAWHMREGWRTQYEGKRVGGTVVVHFIKRNEWFLETALALLGREELVDPKREGVTADLGTSERKTFSTWWGKRR